MGMKVTEKMAELQCGNYKSEKSFQKFAYVRKM